MTDDSIQIDDSSGDETIYDFKTDENLNERYVRYIFHCIF